jgi:hypothetical protein
LTPAAKSDRSRTSPCPQSICKENQHANQEEESNQEKGYQEEGNEEKGQEKGQVA